MQLISLILKKHEEQRLRNGHLWIYSNEINTTKTPLSLFQPGQLVSVQSHLGQALGIAYVNPHSLICARLLSRDPQAVITVDFFLKRLKRALDLRERFFDRPYYRLVFGEADALPGLVIDRFAQHLVVQINTAGMQQLQELLLTALLQLLAPTSITLRNDSAVRELEGLSLSVETVHGEFDGSIVLQENGVDFQTSLLTGQKTGWFYDHRSNRAKLQKYVAARRVLDVFSYIGGWGIQAAVFGAKQVLCLDSSAKALAQVEINAALNQVADKVQTLLGDAFESLTKLINAGERFDVVILDPPAFIKKRKDLPVGMHAYRKLNHLALQLLAPDGLLVSASCSLHLPAASLLDILQAAATPLGKTLQILEQGHQALDHPVHPAIPETNYLKAFFVCSN